MPVKYHCPNCDRRFVDWGAAKLGFKCPDCEDTELVRPGAQEEKTAQQPTLKRRKKKVTKRPLDEPDLAAIELDSVGEDSVDGNGDVEGVDLNLGNTDENEAAATDGDTEEAGGEAQADGDEAQADGDEELEDDLDEEEADMPQDLNFEENGAPDA